MEAAAEEDNTKENISSDEDLNDEKEALLDEHNEHKVDYSKKFRGITAGFLFVLMSVTSGVSVQLLERSIPDFELNTYRSATALVIYGVVFLWQRRIPYIPRTEIWATLLYSLTNIVWTILGFAGVSLVPAAGYQCALTTAKIVSGIILFALFWTEKPTMWTFLTSIICLTGLIMVVQPNQLFKGGQNATSSVTFTNGSVLNHNITNLPEQESTSLFSIIWYIFPVAAGTAASLNTLVMKRNPYISKNMLNVSIWCIIMSTGLSIILMFTFETLVAPRNIVGALYIFLHSITFSFNFPLTMYIAKTISGNTFNLINCSSIVFMLIAQYTVLSSILPGHRNSVEVIGAILVTFGFVLSSIVEIIKNEIIQGHQD